MDHRVGALSLESANRLLSKFSQGDTNMRHTLLVALLCVATVCLSAATQAGITSTTPVAPIVVDEGDILVDTLLVALFEDETHGSTHTAVVNWADGAVNAGIVDENVSAPIGGSPTTGTVSGSHSYADDLTGNVTVSVTNAEEGSTSDVLVAVTVNNVAPSVTAGINQVVLEGEEVQIDAVYTDPGADTHTATVGWGDGSVTPATAVAGVVDIAPHVYADNAPLPIDILVAVTDDDGGLGTDTVTVIVNNADPLTTAGPDQTVFEGMPVIVRPVYWDPGSADTHTAIIDWGDGASQNLVAVGGVIVPPPHVYLDEAGSPFTVTIAVSDDDGGADTDSLEVTVQNFAPVPTVIASDLDIDEGVPLGVAVAFLDTGLLDTHSGTIDWGDGTIEPLTIIANAALASHVYDGEDTTVTIRVSIVDNDGGMGVDTVDVFVRNIAPTVDTGPAVTLFTSETLDLVAVYTDPAPDEGIANVSIGWGDGASTFGLDLITASSTLGGTVTASHSFSDQGRYSVDVYITDDDGGVGFSRKVVTVPNSTPTVQLLNPPPIPFGVVAPIRLTLWDYENDTATLRVQWRYCAPNGGIIPPPASPDIGDVDGLGAVLSGPWRDATLIDPPESYLGTPAGEQHVVRWDALADLGTTETPCVEIAVTPSDMQSTGVTRMMMNLIDTLVPTTPTMAFEPRWTAGLENTVRWTTSTGAMFYEVQIAGDPDFTTPTSRMNPGALRRRTFRNLTNGQQYWYRVRGGEMTVAPNFSPWSNVVSSIQDATSPVASIVYPAPDDMGTSTAIVPMTLLLENDYVTTGSPLGRLVVGAHRHSPGTTPTLANTIPFFMRPFSPTGLFDLPNGFDSTRFGFDGVFSFLAITEDRAGNLDDVGEFDDVNFDRRRIIVDTVVPRSQILNDNRWTNDPNLIFDIVNFDPPHRRSGYASGVVETRLIGSHDYGPFMETAASPGSSDTILFTTPLDGVWDFYSAAVDRGGNVEEQPFFLADVTIRVDATSPTSEVRLDGYDLANDYQQAPVFDIEFVYSDDSPDTPNESGVTGLDLWYSRNGGPATQGPPMPIALSPARYSLDSALLGGDGAYQFWTIGQDAVGNIESAPLMADEGTTVDTVTPESAVDGAALGSINRLGRFNVPVATSDTAAANGFAGGLREVRLFVSKNSTDLVDFEEYTAGGPFPADAPIPFDPRDTGLTFSGEGLYHFYSIVVDLAGNTEAPPATLDASTIVTLQAFPIFDDFTDGAGEWGFQAPLPTTKPLSLEDSGVLGIVATTNVDNFALWESPFDLIPTIPDALYHAALTIQTDELDPLMVPSVRMRANTERQFAYVYEVVSVVDGALAPTTSGVVYDMLFTPAPSAPLAAGIQLSFDMLNFDPNNSPDATVALDEFVVNLLEETAATSAATEVLSYDFATDEEGWSFIGIGAFGLTPPTGARDPIDMTLDITSSNNIDNFGTWGSPRGPVINAGSFYAIDFTVSTTVPLPGEVPGVRLRALSESGQYNFGLSINSDPTLNGSVPTLTPQVYRVYVAPHPLAVGDDLKFGFDLINFNETDVPVGTISLHELHVFEGTLAP